MRKAKDNDKQKNPARRVNTCDYCGPGITHIIDPIAYPNDVIAEKDKAGKC